MGVHGLWTLLDIVGRPVDMNKLDGAVLGVDISIWLHQIVRGMRTRQGDLVRGAHVQGVLARVCRLLHHGIKPVFVFDGGAPALKQKTLAARRDRRAAGEEALRQNRLKLLENQVKQRVLGVSDIPEQQQQQTAKKHSRAEDMYVLPEERPAGLDAAAASQLQMGTWNEWQIWGDSESDSGCEEPAAAAAADLHAFATTKNSQAAASAITTASSTSQANNTAATSVTSSALTAQPPSSLSSMLSSSDSQSEPSFASPSRRKRVQRVDADTVDVFSELFDSLPLDVQYEIVIDRQERFKNRSRHREVRAAPGMSFSDTQIARVVEKNRLSRKLDEIRLALQQYDKIDGVAVHKVISEANTVYILEERSESPLPTPLPQAAEQLEKRQIKAAASAALCALRERQSALAAAHRTTAAEDESQSDSSLSFASGDELDRDEHLPENEVVEVDAVEDMNEEVRIRMVPTEAAAVTETKDQTPVLDHNTVSKHERREPIDNTLAHPSPARLHSRHDTIENSWGEEEEKEAFLASPAIISVEPWRCKACTYVNMEAGLECEMCQNPKASDGTASTTPSGSIAPAALPLSDSSAEHFTLDPRSVLAAPSWQCKLCTYINPCAAEDCAMCEGRREGVERDKRATADTAKAIAASLSDQTVNREPLLPPPKSRKLASIQSPASAHLSSVSDQGLNPRSLAASQGSGEEAPEQKAQQQQQQQQHTIQEEPDQETTEPSDELISGTLWEPANETKVAIDNDTATSMDETHSSKTRDTDTRPAGAAAPGTTTPAPMSRPAESKSIDSTAFFRSGVRAPEPMAAAAASVSLLAANQAQGITEGASAGYVGRRRTTSSSASTAATVSDDAVNQVRYPGEPGGDNPMPLQQQQQQQQPFPPAAANSPPSPPLPGASPSFDPDSAAALDRLESERQALQQDQRRLASTTGSITMSVIADVQKLLQLFGLPYMIAPQEAEAQCAQLELLGLTQGTVTDDSDAFLFGTQKVYRSLFSRTKTASLVTMEDIDEVLGLTRDKLISMASLLGCDYAPGIAGVGPVTAMEVLGEFPGPDALAKFRDWVNTRTPYAELHESEVRQRLRRRKDKLIVAKSFPNPLVRDAFENPVVDDSKQPFSWGRPQVHLLQAFLFEKLGWLEGQTETYLAPVMRKVVAAASTNLRQRRINDYFPAKLPAREDLLVTKAKRLRHAIAHISGTTVVESPKKTKQSSAITRRKGRTSTKQAPVSAAAAASTATEEDGGGLSASRETTTTSSVEQVIINRGPVLTLWVAVVSMRLGFSWESGLTFGRCVANRFAQSKGRRLGILRGQDSSSSERQKLSVVDRALREGSVVIFDNVIRTTNSPFGPLGILDNKVVRTETVAQYLKRAFGPNLAHVRAVFQDLAAAPLTPHALEAQAYALYCQIRPPVASGMQGWGAKGTLDLISVRQIAASIRSSSPLPSTTVA
eukprot:UC1_evm3s365